MRCVDSRSMPNDLESIILSLVEEDSRELRDPPRFDSQQCTSACYILNIYL